MVRARGACQKKGNSPAGVLIPGRLLEKSRAGRQTGSVMKPTRTATLLIALLSLPAAAAKPGIGFAQATGYHKESTRPTLYQPLNLLDGRELTAWCSRDGDFLEDAITVGFKDAVVIDEVRIYTGNGFDDSTFKEFGRAKTLTLEGPEGAQSFTVADVRGLQAVQLNPPVTGAHMKLEVLDSYTTEDPEAPVCITDVVFYSRGKPLNGAWLTSRLKYDRARAPLLGTWFGGDEGAPDHFLAFYVDGTFTLRVEPYDPDKPRQTFRGSFKPTTSSVTFEINGTGRKVARTARTNSADGRKRKLSFEGSLPEAFRKDWRSWK